MKMLTLEPYQLRQSMTRWVFLFSYKSLSKVNVNHQSSILLNSVFMIFKSQSKRQLISLIESLCRSILEIFFPKLVLNENSILFQKVYHPLHQGNVLLTSWVTNLYFMVIQFLISP